MFLKAWDLIFMDWFDCDKYELNCKGLQDIFLFSNIHWWNVQNKALKVHQESESGLFLFNANTFSITCNPLTLGRPLWRLIWQRTRNRCRNSYRLLASSSCTRSTEWREMKTSLNCVFRHHRCAPKAKAVPKCFLLRNLFMAKF